MATAQPRGQDQIRKVFIEKEGSSLRAWLRHFDKNGDDKITFDEFCLGLKELNFQGDVVALWNDMDEDKSGEITLEEIDQESSDIWRSFRRWAATTFTSSREMIANLNSNGSNKVTAGQFAENCANYSWRGHFEELLFKSLDTQGLGYLTPDDVKFVDRERKRMKRKETAKQKASYMQNKKARTKLQAAKALAEFKRHLKKKYGHFVRAWRVAIDIDGSMSVQQKELFKACSAMSWSGDVRALWRALDTDESGVTALEELDAGSAQALARFKEFCNDKFGNVVQGFKAFDRHGIKRLRMPEFVQACKMHGFDKGRFVFEGLNVSGKKFVTEQDVCFLDDWRPPAWLTSYPDEQAATDFKALLLRKYKNYLKAWRRVLDKDSSNRVNWHEFEQCCHRLNFQSNVPGAWRFLDEDLSGYITLREIDESSYDVLMQFKVWADSEFGGVRSGFRVLDSDGSNELSYREFRRAVRDFGFEGNPKMLFESLGSGDVGGEQRKVQLDDIAFLDDWELAEPDLGDLSMEDDLKGLEKKPPQKSGGLSFATISPGPGAYNIPSTFAAPPSAPQARHSGTFSFRKRGLGGYRSQFDGGYVPERDGTPEPGPGQYYADEHKHADGSSRRNPRWRFPTTPRTPRSRPMTPGPGSYDPARPRPGANGCGPEYSMTPRRADKVHPLYKPSGFCLPRAVVARAVSR